MRKWWSCKGGLVNQNTNYDPSARWCVQIVAKRRINILPIKQSHAEAFLQKVETQQETIWREEGKMGSGLHLQLHLPFEYHGSMDQ